MSLKNVDFLIGDAKEKLQELPADHVQTAITSPPYFGLRDYEKENQIGLEESIDDFVENLCNIINETGRVLRSDGTFWLNMGDTYHTGNIESGDIKPKDQCLVPHRVAIELQRRGWYVRSTVIWYRTTAPPESVKDRPTNAHEYFFLLSQSKKYFYDHFAIKEPMKTGAGGSLKNKRDVWPVPGASFGGDHFAVMPLKLVEDPIKASTSKKGQCADCGAPIKRTIERGGVAYKDAGNRKRAEAPGSKITKGHNSVFQEGVIQNEKTSGWEPTCDCDTEETEPQVVLDPFCGSGTTGIAALKHGRKFVGIDLNEEFVDIAKERIQNHEDVPANHSFW